MSKVLYCSACGRRRNDGERFCPGCGNELEAVVPRNSAPLVVGNIGSKQLRLAGILAFGWLVVVVFQGFIGIMAALAALNGTFYPVSDSFLSKGLILVDAFLFCYIYSTLRQLLTDGFRFYAADTHLKFLIWLYVITQLTSALSPSDSVSSAFTGVEVVLGLLLVAAIIAGVIIYLLFCIRLLRLKNNLFGLQRVYAYTGIVAVACALTVVLLPITLLLFVVNCIVLGIILLRAADGASRSARWAV